MLSTDTGLGDTFGKTVIYGNNYSFATVALTAGVTVAENIELVPRSSNQISAAGYVPHIENVSGSNTLSGSIDTGSWGGGSVYTIRSAGTDYGDLLTISGTINASQTGSRSLWLRGPGEGMVTGAVTGSWTSVSFADGGVWTFSGYNTYTGVTEINAGSTLALTGYGSIGSSAAIVLNDSTATLDLTTSFTPTLSLGYTQNLIGSGNVIGNVATTDPSNLIAPSTALVEFAASTFAFNQSGGTMPIAGNFTLGSGGETLQFKLKSSATDPKNDKISVGGAVELNGYSLTKVSIIPDTTLTAGDTYTVLTSANDWTDLGGGGGFVWDSAGNNTRYTFSVDTTTSPKSLLVKVESDHHATLTWSGATDSTWNVKGAANWTGGPVDNQFYQADAVIFTDAAPDDKLTVTLGDTANPALYPASVTVNSTKNFTFSGSGWISGGTGIDKSGTGTLTLGGGNDFTGMVNITEGTLKIGSTKALGSIEGGTVVNGGTLDLNGYYNLRREPISLQGAGVDGNGALVNTAPHYTTGIDDPHQYYVTLAGDAAIGGTYDWSIRGVTLADSGWAPGYLHGNGHTLTKVGTNEIELADLGTTNLGEIDIDDGTLTISGDTELGGSTLIVNSAQLKITSGDHTVGTISGTGTTTVLDSASLSATSITQGSLIIGGTGAAASAAAVPEPGTWMLLTIGLLGIAGWQKHRIRR